MNDFLIDKLYERARDDFDFEAMLKANALPNDVVVALRIFGRALFKAGFYAGYNAGLEVATDLVMQAGLDPEL